MNLKDRQFKLLKAAKNLNMKLKDEKFYRYENDELVEININDLDIFDKHISNIEMNNGLTLQQFIESTQDLIEYTQELIEISLDIKAEIDSKNDSLNEMLELVEKTKDEYNKIKEDKATFLKELYNSFTSMEGDE